MDRINFEFKNKDNISLNAYKWIPQGEVKAIIQISHGMNEHILRYDDFSKRLAKNGYLIYGYDHRGHGKSSSSIENLGYISDEDGFMDMVEDMKLMTDIIKGENQSGDIIIFSHSMGSFLTQRYIQIYPQEIKGAILSGTSGKPSFAINLGIILSKIAMAIKGRRVKISLLDKLSFGRYNDRYEANNSLFDWLSRDEEAVKKYIEDPYCGNLFPVSFFHDLFVGIKGNYKEEKLRQIPKSLAIYIFGGGDDPVGEYGVGIVNLYNLYKRIGIQDLEYKIYESARHEMINEINKNEVIDDLIKWLDKRT